ncbi:hypothetical protein [Serratia marcescens]|uniref:hypothetical protein n=1 Tax=Serratia marcescens TaxID=615 RepID=UPI00237FC7DF|nr:hypothetical protein [Serratia marcescens]MDV5743883.1 hypothetical protein [Serratia marcescens]MDV5748796.1 hypothetical protein [Serratia marcescens]MDV5780232.1 hypothetical protein [Serratia marcescens]MDV5785173.1 hypothetical protein [Serratia marcescens]
MQIAIIFNNERQTIALIVSMRGENQQTHKDINLAVAFLPPERHASLTFGQASKSKKPAGAG